MSVLRVLVYHRLEDPKAPRLDLAPDLVSATPARFAAHLRFLTHWYHPVAADEVLAAIRGVHRLPTRAVLVTFDDAYRDFLDIAWPILRSYGVPAVLFVPTAFAAGADLMFWWDSLWQVLARTCRQQIQLPSGRTAWLRSFQDRVNASRALSDELKMLPATERASICAALPELLGVHVEPTHAVLSWSALRKLQREGLAIAGHSRTHALLDQLNAAELRSEVHGCRDDLARELGDCTPMFAYPNGNVNARVANAVTAAGFEAGFTVVHGTNDLRRVDVRLFRRDDASRRSVASLALRLS